MENEGKSKFESIYSQKVKAGKRRTYFFDVRQTKGNDYYITLTESTKRFNGGGYERHKIFLYKEDFNRFIKGLDEVIQYVKTELMPDFDYEQYERREEEWKAAQAAKEKEESTSAENTVGTNDDDESNEDSKAEVEDSGDESHEDGDEEEEIESEEDMSW